MDVKAVNAMSLGVAEREATESKKAWSAVDYVIEGENASRRYFINRDDQAALLTAVRTLCPKWGAFFLFDGEIAANGAVKICAIYPHPDTEE